MASPMPSDGTLKPVIAGTPRVILWYRNRKCHSQSWQYLLNQNLFQICYVLLRGWGRGWLVTFLSTLVTDTAMVDWTCVRNFSALDISWLVSQEPMDFGSLWIRFSKRGFSWERGLCGTIIICDPATKVGTRKAVVSGVIHDMTMG